MSLERNFLTIKEAAGALRLHPETLRRLLSEGKIPATKIGKSWRIELDAVIASGKN